MARLARNLLLYDGCYAHVMSRSLAKNQIFADDEDFRVFYGLLLKVKQESQFKIFHYCFMHSHFHLAVKIPEVALFSKGLQKLKSQYIYKYHTRYKISGPVWRERYRSLLIEDEAYLYACGQYIENNPVKAGLVKRSEEWQYSSARHYFKKEKSQVIDEYELGLPHLPGDLDIFDRKNFEDGMAIGSKFFKFELSQMFKKEKQEF